VWGFKPTYGRVSRYGLIAFASSLDVIGPIAGDIDTLARVMEVISGPDPKDATTLDFPPFSYGKSGELSAKGKFRVGFVKEHLNVVSDEIREQR